MTAGWTRRLDMERPVSAAAPFLLLVLLQMTYMGSLVVGLERQSLRSRGSLATSPPKHGVLGELKLRAASAKQSDGIGGASLRRGGSNSNDATWKLNHFDEGALGANRRGLLHNRGNKQAETGKFKTKSPLIKSGRSRMEISKNRGRDKTNARISSALKSGHPTLLSKRFGGEAAVSRGSRLMLLRQPDNTDALKKMNFKETSSLKHSDYHRSDVRNEEILSSEENKNIRHFSTQLSDVSNKNADCASNEEHFGLHSQGRDHRVKRYARDANTERSEPEVYYPDYIPSFVSDSPRVDDQFILRSVRQKRPNSPDLLIPSRPRQLVDFDEKDADPLPLLRTPVPRGTRLSKGKNIQLYSSDSNCLAKDSHARGCFCAIVCPANRQEFRGLSLPVLNSPTYKVGIRPQYISHDAAKYSDYCDTSEATENTEHLRNFNHEEKAISVKHDQWRPLQNERFLYSDGDSLAGSKVGDEKSRFKFEKLLRDFKHRLQAGDAISESFEEALKMTHADSYFNEFRSGKQRKFHEKVKHIPHIRDTMSIVKRNGETWENLKINKAADDAGNNLNTIDNLDYQDKDTLLTSQEYSDSYFINDKNKESKFHNYAIIPESNENSKGYIPYYLSHYLQSHNSGEISKDKLKNVSKSKVVFSLLDQNTSSENMYEENTGGRGPQKTSSPTGKEIFERVIFGPNSGGKSYKAQDTKGGLKDYTQEKQKFYSFDKQDSHVLKALSTSTQSNKHSYSNEYVQGSKHGNINSKESTTDKGLVYKSHHGRKVVNVEGTQSDSNESYAEEANSLTEDKKADVHDDFCSQNNSTDASFSLETNTYVPATNEGYRQYNQFEDASLTQRTMNYISHSKSVEKVASSSVTRQSADVTQEVISLSGEYSDDQSKKSNEVSDTNSASDIIENLHEPNSFKENVNEDKRGLVESESTETATYKQGTAFAQKEISESERSIFIRGDGKAVMLTHTSAHIGESSDIDLFHKQTHNVSHSSIGKYKDLQNMSLKVASAKYDSNEHKGSEEEIKKVSDQSPQTSIYQSTSQAGSKENKIWEFPQLVLKSQNSTRQLNFSSTFEQSETNHDIKPSELAQVSGVESKEPEIIVLSHSKILGHKNQGKISLVAAEEKHFNHEAGNLNEKAIPAILGSSKVSQQANEAHLVSSSNANVPTTSEGQISGSPVLNKGAEGTFIYEDTEESSEKTELSYGKNKYYEHGRSKNLTAGGKNKSEIFLSGSPGRKIITSYNKYDTSNKHIGKNYETARHVTTDSVSLPSFGIVSASQKVSFVPDEDCEQQNNLNHFNHGVHSETPFELNAEQTNLSDAVVANEYDIPQIKLIPSNHYHSITSIKCKKMNDTNNAGIKANTFPIKEHGTTANKHDKNWINLYSPASRATVFHGRNFEKPCDVKSPMPLVVQASHQYRQRQQGNAQPASFSSYGGRGRQLEENGSTVSRQDFPFASHNSRPENTLTMNNLQARKNSDTHSGNMLTYYDSALQRNHNKNFWKNKIAGNGDNQNYIFYKKHATDNINKFSTLDRHKIQTGKMFKVVPSCVSSDFLLRSFSGNEEVDQSQYQPEDSFEIQSGNRQYFPEKHQRLLPAARKTGREYFPANSCLECSKRLDEPHQSPHSYNQPHFTSCWSCARARQTSNRAGDSTELNFERMIYPSAAIHQV